MGIWFKFKRFHTTLMHFCSKMCLHRMIVDEIFGTMQTIELGEPRLIQIHTLIQQFGRFCFQIIVNLRWKRIDIGFLSCNFCSAQHFNVSLWYVPDPSPACDFLFAICAANVYHRNAPFVDAVAYPFFKFRQIFTIKIRINSNFFSKNWNFTASCVYFFYQNNVLCSDTQSNE